jgi:cytochrome c-type biogenesis protein CcmH
MSPLFWAFAIAMLIVAVGFVTVPLQTGKSLVATPKLLLAVFVPLFAVGLYAFLGADSNVATQHVATNGNAKTGPTADSSLGSVASMVEGLAARLENEPDDADGWILLARSYLHVERPADALNAYERARALGKTDANLEAQLIGDSVAKISAEQTDGISLRGRIALTPAATATVQPGDTVFIFAKESREHRMPVVALRKSVSDLPLEFVLTDKEVMVPGSKLGDYQELVVTAKVSRSGNATDNTLGLEAWSSPVSPSNPARIDLLIDSSHE